MNDADTSTAELIEDDTRRRKHRESMDIAQSPNSSTDTLDRLLNDKEQETAKASET